MTLYDYLLETYGDDCFLTSGAARVQLYGGDIYSEPRDLDITIVDSSDNVLNHVRNFDPNTPITTPGASAFCMVMHKFKFVHEGVNYDIDCFCVNAYTSEFVKRLYNGVTLSKGKVFAQGGKLSVTIQEFEAMPELNPTPDFRLFTREQASRYKDRTFDLPKNADFCTYEGYMVFSRKIPPHRENDPYSILASDIRETQYPIINT